MKSTENMYLADLLMFYLDHQDAIDNMKLIVSQEMSIKATQEMIQWTLRAISAMCNHLNDTAQGQSNWCDKIRHVLQYTPFSELKLSHIFREMEDINVSKAQTRASKAISGPKLSYFHRIIQKWLLLRKSSNTHRILLHLVYITCL